MTLALPDIQWVFPEAAVLALPAAIAWWLWCRNRHGRFLRAVVLALLVIAAMQPELAWGRGGSDVVMLLDRSSSMEESARAKQEELVRLVGEQRQRGDRLAVVVVGENALVAQAPQGTGLPRLADMPVEDSASELARGLDIAAGLFAPGRTGRVVLHSDGEFTGLEPRRAASRLATMEIPIDVICEKRPPLADAAVLDIELPQHLRFGESFLGAVRFLGDSRESRKYRVLRGSHEVVSGKVDLMPGKPVAVSFADRPVQPGLTRYRVELDTSNDRMPMNNTAGAALHVAGGERVLVVGGDGSPGNVANALRSAGLTVTCRAEGPLMIDDLMGVRVLLLEQVPADKLGIDGLNAIAHWVEHLGGGLIMTGGRRSFGAGGYHKSAVERVLPVTMELRDEHRKLAVSMAIALDVSGSMQAPVAGGRIKLDLANEGAASAIEMLSQRDQVSVDAVDSAPTTIVPMMHVDDAQRIIRQVLGIKPGGGGIFCYQALLAAGKQVLTTTTGTRHVVLFADAADAEEPGEYVKLLEDYVKAGITVSVIGMGSEKDSDAEFLKDIAKRGNGRISFAEKPEDIPRLFAQETVLIARSAWIDGEVRIAAQPPLAVELGSANFTEAWPTIPGYNLTYARERATVLALAPGDPQAPALASWRIGTGRSVAIGFNVDDPNSKELMGWKAYGRLLASLVRWAAGADEDAPGVLAAERAGRTVRLRLSLDPAKREHWPDGPVKAVLDANASGETAVAMDMVDDGVYEGLFRLEDERVIIPSVAVNEQAIIGPALSLPYSPEAEPRFGRTPGSDVLSALSRDTLGKVRTDVVGVFENPPSRGDIASAATALLIAALALMIGEIAVRRMQLAWMRKRPAHIVKPVAPAVPVAVAAQTPGAAPAPDTAVTGPLEQDRGLHEALRQLRNRQRK